MKTLTATVLIVIAVPALAFAGEIYGTINEAGKPVAEGLTVEVACGDAKIATTTDKNGAYRLVAPDDEKCTLELTVGEEKPSITVHSFEDSARYNLVLEKKDGKYTLRGE